MKNLALHVALLFCIAQIHAQVGIGTITPQGVLDITSSTSGVVVPRVGLTSKSVAAPIINPQTGTLADGTLVWNTSTAGSGSNSIFPGFYFWQGGQWHALADGSGKDWSLSGNTGTDPVTTFIGTTDNTNLVFKTNNTQRMTISEAGNLGIGTVNPTSKLEIDANTESIPPLRLVPSTTVPTGTKKGEIAIIDDCMYMYDKTRLKWMSVETLPFAFGFDGANIEGIYLDFANVNNKNRGAKMPYNGTIVGITVQSGGTNPTKKFEIRKNDEVFLYSFNLVAKAYDNTTENIDFNAADNLNVFVTDEGDPITSPTVILFVKWRK